MTDLTYHPVDRSFQFGNLTASFDIDSLAEVTLCDRLYCQQCMSSERREKQTNLGDFSDTSDLTRQVCS